MQHYVAMSGGGGGITVQIVTQHNQEVYDDDAVELVLAGEPVLVTTISAVVLPT